MMINWKLWRTRFITIVLGSLMAGESFAECAVPLEGCRRSIRPERDRFLLIDGKGDRLDRVNWRWSNGEATSKEDFGNPVSGSYGLELCVYSQQSDGNWSPFLGGGLLSFRCVLESPDGTGQGCWKNNSKRGFSLNFSESFLKLNVKLQAGTSGNSSILFHIAAAGIVEAEMMDNTNALVQVRSETSGACWESEFTD